jgi:hypothetical protein
MRKSTQGQLAEIIRDYCNKNGLVNSRGAANYAAFAAKCEISSTTVYNILTDPSTNITSQTIESILDITGGQIIIGE